MNRFKATLLFVALPLAAGAQRPDTGVAAPVFNYPNREALLPLTHPLLVEAPQGRDAGMVQFATFAIDVYEYPNQAGSLPRTEVSLEEARALCRKRGKRLCSEGEWELACRGAQDLAYGYGPQFGADRCNTPYPEGEIWKRRQGPAPSGAFAGCATPEGVHDLVGNVWEWTEGTYDPQQGWAVVRGGSWFHSVNYARADGRYGRYLSPDYHLDLIGFRCCR
ncbi:MAG: SUMF1/EgtB/PvdO family nonheme iron enzyme [Candidatus Handelsmanbacteria bacterium]|nr:SUMF1/EgtB/PvdO family nonheme iron enzyme [Candidatus Handelsmanbacteria bacterium]